ncbi:Cholecystokinin receptor [Trichoplax sp. H2]|nr:Cholecystokinin receptor [Trichoplax sp. H2]|eukprot:RDD37889.1 Cholecystokinin receptor [Trichoplax sp. H2]
MMIVQSNQTPNISALREFAWEKQQSMKIVLPTMITLSILGIAANCIICYAIIKKKELRAVTYYLMINMAISDCLILAVLSCIEGINYYLTDHVASTPLLVAFCKILGYFNSISYHASTCTLAAISIERYYILSSAAIHHPSFFNTASKLRLMIGYSWLAGFIIAMPSIIVYGIDINYPYSCSIGFISPSFNIPYFITVFIVLLVVPSIIIIIMYGKIIRYLYKNVSNNDRRHTLSQGFKNNRQHQRNTIKMLVLVTASFTISCYPIFLAYISVSIQRQSTAKYLYENRLRASIISKFMIITYTLPCILHPLIYLHYNRSIRGALIDCCRYGHTPSSSIAPANSSKE